MVMTLVLLKIVELEIRNLKTFCFYLISFNIMVGFKAKARASAYFTKLGWRRGCAFVGGVWGVLVCVGVWGSGWGCVWGVCVGVCVRGWVYVLIVRVVGVC